MLHLTSKYGDNFRVLAPGTHEQKIAMAIHPELAVNRMVEIQYAQLSNQGIPMQPVAKRFVEVF
ncbi:MAG: hypothetical protein IMF12_03155 [Proteobacteria bacterium]|nr:hypothetical protein [Pseudomonadota bacterium]